MRKLIIVSERCKKKVKVPKSKKKKHERDNEEKRVNQITNYTCEIGKLFAYNSKR